MLSIDVGLNVLVVPDVRARNTKPETIRSFALFGAVDIDLTLGGVDLIYPYRPVDLVGTFISNFLPDSNARYYALDDDVSYYEDIRVLSDHAGDVAGSQIPFRVALNPTLFVQDGIAITTFGAVDGGTLTLTYNYGPLVAPVPLPSTWAMMLIGFAGLCLTTTRQSKKLLS